MPSPSDVSRRARERAARSLPETVLALTRTTLVRLVAVQFVDRAVALGALAFTAIVPLLLVVGAFAPGGDGFADALIDRFRLSGSSAALLEDAFARPDDVKQTVSWMSVVLVLVSALSFTRALQRVYEQSWGLTARGVRGSAAGLQWLLGIALWATAFAALRRALVEATGGLGALVVALAGACLLWLWSPYVLLGRRVAWRRLWPTAVLTAVAVTALSAASVVSMPDAIAASAERYGPIGIAIALVSWLVCLGFVLVVCAVVGAVLGGARADAEPEDPEALRVR